jgi:hypothetical protein
MNEERPVRDEAYNAQREELLRLLNACRARYEPLRAHEKPVLAADEIPGLLQKIRHGLQFSRKEKAALLDAGFHIDKLYPDLI